ncbi:peptidylprolyl isomerase [Hymenobacter sp. IS2118]|uniref:peptidylprolyl isomerase n=1 Tax=Hymenobacter sp. IS2118 TaxID=1505605 RepID=UPI00055066A3|nr:peptidylprolyl isomerase [Hymenobacter sp. IS2118]
MKLSIHRFGLLLLTWLWAVGTVVAADKPAKPAKKSSRDEVVTITTAQGVIRVILFDDTPLHKANFLNKAKSGFYDGTSFHRVIPDFMIQGGDINSKDDDPSNDGLGRADDGTIAAELGPGHQHNFGALAAARQGDFANPQRASSISQFYLVQNHDGTHRLDGQYTVYGQAIQGLDVIDKIAALPRNSRDHPNTDAKMTMKVEKLKRKKITKLYGYKYE